MVRLFKKIFQDGEGTEAPRDRIDLEELMAEIREREDGDIPRGRKIHQFGYGIFEIRLDRDITERYRVTVMNGRERVYSFTVKAGEGDYEILREGFDRILEYLDGERDPSGLPDDSRLKGHYYGR